MKLSPEQKEKLLKHISSKWKPPYKCSCCGENNWDVTDEVFQIIQFSQGSIVLGGPIVPLAPVTCVNCGNTVLINALVAGIVEPPTKQDKKPEEKKGGGDGNG